MSRKRLLLLAAIFTVAAVAFNWSRTALLAEQGSTAATAKTGGKVSFSKQVRPLLQDNCYGCHQPAKAQGGFEMISRAGLLRGGESESPAVVSGKPEESNLLDQITPKDGKAEMPRGRAPLAAGDIDLVRRWIAEGAEDDSPVRTQPAIDARHPPVYSRSPQITSLDFSPDGKLLAVSGFHEALLWKADGSTRVARLVGLSERIETVRFSPDGAQAAGCRRQSLPQRRMPGVERGLAKARRVEPGWLRHALRRQLVARRPADRGGSGRQRSCGPSTRRTSSK